MSPQRHTIRKLEHPESLDFDEQLWPVNLALVLACGCVSGMIWAICDFNSPILYENGYFWLAVLLGSVVGLGGLAMYLGGRPARRLQMAAFLSLALHGVGLGGLAMYRGHSDWTEGPKREAGNRELRPIDVLPDYHLTRVLPNRVQEDVEKPVETKVPDELVLEAIQPKPRAERADLGALKPAGQLAIADPAPQLIAPPLERKSIEPAAPRRGDLEAKLAKQQPPTVSAPAAGPMQSIDLSVPTSKAGPLEARSMPLGRQTTDPNVPRRPDDTAVAMIPGLMQPGGPRSAPAPRTNAQLSPLIAAGPTLVKTITEPGPIPRGDGPAPAAAAKAAVPDLSQLRPATGSGRQSPAGAVIGRIGIEFASAAPIAAPTVALPRRISGPQPGRGRLSAGPNPDTSLPTGSAVGNGKPGFSGIGIGTSSGAVPAGAVAISPFVGDVALGGGNGPATVSYEVASAAGAQHSEIGGPIGRGGGSGGDGSGGNGEIGAAQIGRPGAVSEELPSGIAGGIPGGLGAGIGRAGQPGERSFASAVQGDLPQRAAGSPTGNGNQTGASDGNGPGGGPNGFGASGIEGAVAGVGRQTTGGLPTGGGSGAGDGTGQPGVGVEGVLGGAQIAGPGSAEGAPGQSGNGEGGPSAVGAGLGGLLPKSNAIGTRGGINAQGGAPQFAGSPTISGPGNNASGAAGGTGDDGPGGPGGSGPGGDGSGQRYGSAGLPAPASIGNPDSATGGVPQFGLPDRRALPDNDQLAISSGRFLQRQAGGGGPEVAADAPVRAPTPSFSGRGREGRVGTGNGNGDSDGRTEQSIELGLVYLAQMQAADGSWSLHRFPGATDSDVGMYRSDTAATGLALLAFLGAGYDHFDDKYHDTVRRGLEYLLRNQKPDGDLFLPMEQAANLNRYSRFYSHAIATIAVCEALGMTGDKRLSAPAQKAINFIIASQDPKLGGWRYDSRDGTDTSVTGWQTTALKSGELAGLNVPQEAYERVSQFLDSAQITPRDASRYIYNPQNPQSQLPADSQRPTMTAVALLQRIYLGWRRDNPDLLRGADFIKANLPRVTDVYSRDTYYWYYATQVMFQLKGEYWRIWSEHLHPLLVNSQIASGSLAGSWDPQGRVADRWGYVGGRIYVTTMNLLSLEVYYRHLPIYEVVQPK